MLFAVRRAGSVSSLTTRGLDTGARGCPCEGLPVFHVEPWRAYAPSSKARPRRQERRKAHNPDKLVMNRGRRVKRPELETLLRVVTLAAPAGCSTRKLASSTQPFVCDDYPKYETVGAG